MCCGRCREGQRLLSHCARLSTCVLSSLPTRCSAWMLMWRACCGGGVLPCGETQRRRRRQGLEQQQRRGQVLRQWQMEILLLEHALSC